MLRKGATYAEAEEDSKKRSKEPHLWKELQ